MNTALRKREIRTQWVNLRETHDDTTRLAKSHAIAQTVLMSDSFADACILHIYMATLTEVQTDTIIEEALHRGKRVVVPAIINNRINLVEIDDLHPMHFRVGPFGIREPLCNPAREVKKETVDLFIVPGVAYDKTGKRLGRGGGYYDRLLEGVTVPIIGLSFEMQMVDDLPVESTDINMDQIITEERIIVCKRNERT